MSFQDPPRRRRPPRYPALAQHQDGPSPYRGAHARYGGGPGDQGGYRGFASPADTSRQRPPWEMPARNTGAHRATRDASARDAAAQETSWDLAGGRAAEALPRRTSGAFRAVPDDDPGRPRVVTHGGRQGDGRGIEEPRSRGLLAGGLSGFLAAAVALGVANLVAAFVRPQASPIIAVGGAFIDRTPSALKNFAVAKFGENDKNMLLLGMYVTIALIAITIGVLAWRRLWIGVAGIGLFGLFGAFVAITRPESHVTDVIPSIVGGIAGIAAMVSLVRAGLTRTRAAAAAWARGR